MKKGVFLGSIVAAMALSCGLVNNAKAKSFPVPGMTAENTISINKKVFVRNPKQSAKVNAKRKALINAENKLSELQGQIKSKELETGGASGFFRKIAESSSNEEQKQDAMYAYSLLNGEADDTPNWYDTYVRLGQCSDATSVQNLYRTLPYYDQFIKIRQNKGLSVPNVSLSTIAAEMLDADYSSKVIDHARHFTGSENLAWNCEDNANDMWMSEESIWNKAVKKDSSLAQYKNNLYGLMQTNQDLAENVGHYLNLINPNMQSFGYALNTSHGKFNDTEAFGADYAKATFSIDEFKSAVRDYYNDIEKPDQVKKAKSKVKTAEKNLKKAIKESKKHKKSHKTKRNEHIRHSKK